jgi:hypothetical protein
MEFFWNLVVSFEFSFSYPYGNNHKRLYEALSQSHEKPILTQHVLHILSKFWSRFHEKLYVPHPKVELLNKMQDWRHFFTMNDGGIPPIHEFLFQCSFITSWMCICDKCCHKHQHDNLLLLYANVPHKVFAFYWGNPSIQILFHQWLSTTICLEVFSTCLWWREHHWDQNNIHDFLKKGEKLHLLHKFEQMLEKLIIQSSQSWASYLHV